MTATFEPTSLEAILLALFPREHISPSAAKQYIRCPEQFRRYGILGQKAKPKAAMEWGSADHAAAGFNYQQKIQTERDLPVSEVQEFFVNDFEKRLDELGGADEVEWEKDLADKTPAEGVAAVKDKGTQLVAAYHEQIAGDMFPETVEEPIYFEPDGLGLPVKGFIDVTARRRDGFTKEMSKPMILERKTRNALRAPSGEDRFQARVYQLAKPLPAEFHISSRPNTRVQVYEPLPVVPAEITVASLRATILDMAHSFALYGPDQPWPDRGRLHTWACDFCGFKSSCPWHHPEYWPK